MISIRLIKINDYILNDICRIPKLLSQKQFVNKGNTKIFRTFKMNVIIKSHDGIMNAEMKTIGTTSHQNDTK